MFEYLMPLLVMRNYPGTLLDETYEAVIERQMHYGDQRGVPWGISESAYNLQDLEGNYQYNAFGVPGLGLKRGLAEDLVVAPYATVLAAPLAPAEVVRNLERLRAEGLAGRYGYYESIDYTPERLPENSAGGVALPTFMAHHQGMSLVALDNLLNGSPMQNRFHADPRIQASELLLQERVPQLVPLKNPPIETAEHVPSARGACHAAGPPLRHAVHVEPAGASAVERILLPDDHQRRRRLQPSPATGADQMARGHHRGRLGQLLLRPRPRDT